MKKLLIAAAAAATLAAPQAFAQAHDKGTYLGLGLGQSTIKLNSSDFSYLSSKSENGTGFKVYGGYTINKHFAAEVAYADLGKATGKGTTGSDSYKASALTFSGVGFLPLGDTGFSLIGKLGVSSNFIVDDFVGSNTTNLKKTTTDIHYGIGAKYAINKKMAVRAEYEDFGKAGDQGQLTRSTLNLLSVNLEFQF